MTKQSAGMKTRVEVRYQTVTGHKAPVLDEVLLFVNGKCLFHLEQMADEHWWMLVGDGDRLAVHVTLFTTRANIRGVCRDEGSQPPNVTLNGTRWSEWEKTAP